MIARAALRLSALLLLVAGAAGAQQTAAAGWDEALRLEAAGDLLPSAARFEAAAEAGRAEAWWRAARGYWRFAESLPLDEAARRTGLFTHADGCAARGLEADPSCGECALWRYASLGRLTEHLGWLWGARHAREMRDLLDLGIALKPRHRDANGNSELANLYYASAIFHRLVPEGIWLRLLVGVRGDTDRALDDIHRALAISAGRVDYHVEHGAVLLCQGRRRHDAARTREGRDVLRHALSLAPSQPSDVVDQRYAAELLVAPEKACGFSRRGFIDTEGEGRAVAIHAGR